MSLHPEQFQTGALVYNIERQELSRDTIICADEATPEKYPPHQHHFYCPDCIELGHFTRLVRIKETDKRSPRGIMTPAKFDLFKKEYQTHQCNHPVRFRELDNLAVRYDVVCLNDNEHSYAFPITIHKREAQEGIYNIKRLEKVLLACMFDEELREKQFFDVGGIRHSLSDLFNGPAAEGLSQNFTYYAAAIFRPIARPDLQHQNAYKGEITGMNDTALSCSQEIYKAVKDMVIRYGAQKSAPVLVFGRAVLNVENLKGHRPFTRFVVDDLKQVTPWAHPTSFDDMINNQAEPPPPYNLALFNPVRALRRA